MLREFERSKRQICFNVLEIISEGAQKPTRIMQDSNLSWTTLLEVFRVLTSQGLIKSDFQESYKRYTLTDKGLKALTHFSKALDILDVTEEARSARYPAAIHIRRI
jgi:predicted transcriptional regulator